MSDLVSVIFPVGPGVPEAGLALSDLCSQTWQELEIVAVLNGCLPTVRADFLAKSDSRLRVFDRGEVPDLLGALQFAMAKSRGRWLARMDSDDRCAPERIEKTLAPLLKGECDVSSCGIELVGALGDGMQRYVDWVNGLIEVEDVRSERFIESPVVQPTVILSKETFFHAGGYCDDGYAEDYDLWLRLAGMGFRFGKVSEKLYQWHDRAGRLTRTHERYGQKEMIFLKARALAQEPCVREGGVAISGAGPIGKMLARELIARGVQVHGFFEVSPKRIGSVCQERPIAGLNEFGTRWRSAVLLSAVGIVGGRDKVRVLAHEKGYQEGVDFFCCC